MAHGLGSTKFAVFLLQIIRPTHLSGWEDSKFMWCPSINSRFCSGLTKPRGPMCCPSTQRHLPWAQSCFPSQQRMDAANSMARKGENHRGQHTDVLSCLCFTSLHWQNRYGGVCPFVSRLCDCKGRGAASHPAAVKADIERGHLLHWCLHWIYTRV